MTQALGYKTFAAAGGDWGALVTSDMGHAHADHLRGIYLTLPVIPGVNREAIPDDAFAPDENLPPGIYLDRWGPGAIAHVTAPLLDNLADDPRAQLALTKILMLLSRPSPTPSSL